MRRYGVGDVVDGHRCADGVSHELRRGSADRGCSVLSRVGDEFERRTLDMGVQQGQCCVRFAGQHEFLEQTVLGGQIAIDVVNERAVPPPIQFGAVA
jgi:hypothetical protein